MKPEAIVAPVGVLAIWTLFILFLVAFRRIEGTRARRVPRGAFRLGESPEVPPDIVVANRNYMNLLEAPILFYVAALTMYATRHVAPGQIALAWIYVALRLVHSFVHLSKNRIIPRLVVFALSNLVLLAIWIWILCSVL